MRLLGWAALLFNWWRNFYSETHMDRKQCKKVLGEDGLLQAERLGTDPTLKASEGTNLSLTITLILDL